MLNNFNNKLYKAEQPHGEIVKVFDNVYMVTGTNQFSLDGIDYCASRNMIIVRSSNNHLMLINTVRLNDEQLAKLKEVGEIKHIIRIGAFHGYDDKFYVEAFKADYWILPSMQNEYEIENPKHLTNDTMPLPDCTVFEYTTTKMSEGALLLNQEGGILITCDSIQNITKKDELMNDACWDMYVKEQSVGTAHITKTWIGACEPKKEDFIKLIGLPFKHLITAHGEPLKDIASKAVSNSIKAKF